LKLVQPDARPQEKTTSAPEKPAASKPNPTKPEITQGESSSKNNSGGAMDFSAFKKKTNGRI